MSLIEKYYDKRARNYVDFSARYRNIDRSTVLDLLELEPGMEVLDAGCGSGYFAIPLKELGYDVLGVDKSPEMIKYLRKQNIKGRVATIDKMDLQKKYDRIICYGVLEFVDDIDASLLGLKNHLSDEGLLLIGAPTRTMKSIPYFLYHLLINRITLSIFTEKKFQSLLERSGFRLRQIVRINSLDRVFLCTKSKV